MRRGGTGAPPSAGPATSILLSPGGVTRLVTRLERDRLVRRVAAPCDGRSSLATLTAAGRRRLREARPTTTRSCGPIPTERLTEAELASLGALWGKVLGT